MRSKRAQVALCVLLPLTALILLASPRWNEWRSLASLRKVDDHPLYLMRYYGDYDLPGLSSTGTSAEKGRQSSALPTARGWACTCFSSLNQTGEPLFGRNFDWHEHPALLLFTDPPDRYASVSMVDISYLGFGSEAPSLRDRRGLLYAVQMPFDGMNECGLAVGMMAVPEANSGHDPQKMAVSDLGAIRLLLDHASDVDEAVALLDECNVVFSEPFLHYLIADAGGDSAVIEFVDGEMRVLHSQQPWQVATNFVISTSMPEGGDSPCWRYNTAHDLLQSARGKLSATEAMALLERVSQNSTIWSIVYGIDSGDVQVVMGREYGQVHRFTFWR
jgi:hypothetical protein